MGKQIHFYMDACDEDGFIQHARGTGNVVIIPQTSEQDLKERFQNFRGAEGRQLGESCHLWNCSISPRPITKYYPSQGYYWLDFLQSEVVNVIRSKIVEHEISLGRLHIEDRFLGSDGQVHLKGKDL